MPRPENRFDREHLRRLQQIQALIDRIYDEAVREAAAIGAGVADFDPSKAFEFADYPLTERRMAELTAWLRSQLSAAVVDGVEAAWTLSNNKNNELVHHVFGDRYDQLPEVARRRYLSTNETARDAFLRRKQQGLGLSERVWQYAEGFKDEMEMGIDLGIRSGKPAAEMARDLKQYLQHPDRLFRRVRDEHGSLHLSKRAAAFHPGRGVYRSSYMNARRLAVTETNMAYRTADHERWRQMDFVVGIEIHLSNNHNCKGVPRGLFTDMCDALQGRYPKDFKFTGWHPHCRCYATTVLKTPEEMDADTARILNGEPVDGESENKVDDVPEGFRKWVEENKKRAETHYSVPYFLKDNLQYVPKALMEAYGSRMPYDTYAEYEAAMKYNKKHSTLTKEQMNNVRELNRVMPVVQGKIMDIDEADRGHCNPMFGTENYVEKGYNDNCQTCTMAYELRRRGFNINAMGSPNGELDFYQFCKNNGLDWKHRFLNADGSTCDYSWSNKQSSMNDTVAKKKGFIQGCMSESGRYEIYCSWKGKKNIAHVFVIEKQPNGNMMWFDPQTGETGKVVEKKVSRMKAFQIGVMRIDDKIINPRFAPRFLKS